MTDEPQNDHPEVDAVTAEETATGMTDEQLLEAWAAVTDGENLTDVEEAVLAEIEKRNLNI